jgi:hypothetical protein
MPKVAPYFDVLAEKQEEVLQVIRALYGNNGMWAHILGSLGRIIRHRFQMISRSLPQYWVMNMATLSLINAR